MINLAKKVQTLFETTLCLKALLKNEFCTKLCFLVTECQHELICFLKAGFAFIAVKCNISRLLAQF